MKFRHLILVSIVSVLLASPAQAQYLRMMRQYGYTQNRPPAISPTVTIQHVNVQPITTTTQSITQFESQPPQFIQYQDGMNLYQYIASNPLMYLDPMGLLKIHRKSCIKCRWAGDKPYREKFRKMM